MPCWGRPVAQQLHFLFRHWEMYNGIKKQIKYRVTFQSLLSSFQQGLVKSVKGFYVLLCFLKFLWLPQHPGAVIYVTDLYYVNYHCLSNCHLTKCMSYSHVLGLWEKVNCSCLTLPWLWRALSFMLHFVTFSEQKMMIHVPHSLLLLLPSCHLIKFFLRNALSWEHEHDI